MAQDYKDKTVVWVAAQPLIANGWNLAGISRAIAVTYQLLHTAYNGKRLTMPRGKQLVLARRVMALGLKPELKKKHMPDWEGRRQKRMEATQRIMSVFVTLREREWTRRDVTNRTGIPITMVRHYEKGNRLPSHARRKKIYALLEQRRPRRAEEIILAAMTRRAKNRIYNLTMHTLSRDTGYTDAALPARSDQTTRGETRSSHGEESSPEAARLVHPPRGRRDSEVGPMMY